VIVRFREDERNHVHTRVSVFSGMGDEDSTLGLAGHLVLDTPVWDALEESLPRLIGKVLLAPPREEPT